MSDWIDDHLIGIIVGACLLVVALIIYLSEHARSECKSSGGQYVQVGTYPPTYVKSGNVYIPIENPKYACIGGH